MPLLTAARTYDGDPIALAIIALLLAMLAIALLRKRAGKKAAPAAAVIPAAPAPLAPGSAGQIRLNGVEPKTAAMAMAIVADRLDKPINELRFISIKEVK